VGILGVIKPISYVSIVILVAYNSHNNLIVKKNFIEERLYIRDGKSIRVCRYLQIKFVTGS